MANAEGFSPNKKPPSSPSALPRRGKLPEELVGNILSRLPVKSLVRFEAVSKSWQSRIKSPKFIKMHLACTSAKNPKRLIVHSLNRECDFPDYTEDLITLHDLKSPQKDAEFLGLPYLRDSRPEMGVTILIGSFNGIVCVLVKDDLPAGKHYFYLWNPATQQSKHLPGPTIDDDESIYYSVGFGFDSIADDYKVVRVLEFGGEGSIRAEVYSAVEDCWREVKVELSFYVDFFNCDASVKGVLYWSAGEHLVTYDLNSELFNNKIVLPNVEKTGGTERCIAEFRDSVALCVYNYNGECNNEVSIWTLDDGLGKGCWSKKLSFESLPKMERVFGYLMTGDNNILGKNKESLILYDPKSQQTKNLSMPIKVYTTEVLNYGESLVTIKGSTHVPRKAKKRIRKLRKVRSFSERARINCIPSSNTH